MAHNTGNGATIAFTGISTEIISINPGGLNRGSIDDNLLATQDYAEFIQEDLITTDPIEVTFAWDTDDALVDITNGPSTITITWPLDTGQATAASLTGTGFLTKVTFPELVNNTRQEATATLMFDGKTGPTYAEAVAS